MAERIERDIAERMAAAGIRLRYDRVALRFVGSLAIDVAQVVPEDQSIIFTVTAPIKRPAKTRAALQNLLSDLPAGELSRTVNGNEIRARRVAPVSIDRPRVLGFVHNPQTNAGLILDLAQSRLGDGWPIQP